QSSSSKQINQEFNESSDNLLDNRKRSRAGERYFDELRTHFWKRPDKRYEFNNSKSYPPPSYEEVAAMLNRHREMERE
ncbi:2537_t:CDS:2, partial [Gigaspora margarita]